MLEKLKYKLKTMYVTRTNERKKYLVKTEVIAS